MVFPSLTFLVFAALFFPAFFLTRGRFQSLITLVASYVFYGWWDWRFMALLAVSTVGDYTIGRLLARTEATGTRRLMLTVSIAANLSYLGFFKYFNFFASSMAALLHGIGLEADWATLHIVLPVGISFYTFQSMSYTIDVYYRRLAPERDFLIFATFIALFPQLVAGPIVRARWLLPQLHRTRRFRWANLFVGLEMIITGFFLKLVVADNISPFVTLNFQLPEAYNSLSLLLAVILFAFQIYGDFAGYSLIAIGLARIIGYKFPANFRRPYFSRSFSEFWTRWHISLSSWLRDYLYIPLGGNRHGKARTHRNLLATMLLGGLWHGANWTFIGWGALHGCYLVGQRLLGDSARRVPIRLPVPRAAAYLVQVLAVFTLVSVAWVFFRAPSFSEAVIVLRRVLLLDDWHTTDLPLKFHLVKALALVVLLVAIEIGAEHSTIRNTYFRSRAARTGGMLALLWLIPLAGSFAGAQFIYFQF